MQYATPIPAGITATELNRIIVEHRSRNCKVVTAVRDFLIFEEIPQEKRGAVRFNPASPTGERDEKIVEALKALGGEASPNQIAHKADIRYQLIIARRDSLEGRGLIAVRKQGRHNIWSLREGGEPVTTGEVVPKRRCASCRTIFQPVDVNQTRCQTCEAAARLEQPEETWKAGDTA